MYHDLVVIKNFKHDMILGVDFLKARKAIIDFESQVLIIGNVVFPLKQKPNQNRPETSLVRLAEDVDVFPRSGVQVKCFIAKKKQPDKNFVVSQLASSPCFENEPGVLLPNALVKASKNNHVPWVIVNETGRQVHFRKGQVLGTATPTQGNEPNITTISSDTDETTELVDGPADFVSAFNLDHVTEEQQEALVDLLKRNLDVFVQKNSELTTTNVTEMTINTQNHPSSYQTPRRPPLAYKDILEDQIQEMLKANVTGEVTLRGYLQVSWSRRRTAQ